MPAVEALRRYADFTGRSTRTEYWGAFAIWYVAGIILGVLDTLLFYGGDFESIGEEFMPLGTIFVFATIVPFIAVMVRRLRDGLGSGWWAIIAAFPLIGWLIAFVILPITPSRPTPYYQPEDWRSYPDPGTAVDRSQSWDSYSASGGNDPWNQR